MDTIKSQGAVGSDPQNSADLKGIHTRSTFNENDLGYNFFATLPFGEIRPFTFFESVPDDKRIRAQFISQVQSYTLKAPIMQSIHMKKLVAQVPRESILPFNWEKWFKNPVIGDDIPGDVGTSVLGFWNLVANVAKSLRNALPDSVPSSAFDINYFFTMYFKYFVVMEMFYSDGNLLKHCNISGRPWCFSYGTDGLVQHTVDYAFDKFCSYFLALSDVTWSFTVHFGSDSYEVYPSVRPANSHYGKVISFREFLSLIRDDLSFTLTFTFSDDPAESELQPYKDVANNVINDGELLLLPVEDDNGEDSVAIDLKRVWAYQLVCAHFLTNDSVDFVYSAELYRQYIWSLIKEVLNASQGLVVDDFTVNGMSYQYDFLSAHYFTSVLTYIASEAFNSVDSAFAYLSALFTFKRSLRYLDYFTGSKTRPLAVGDVNVSVDNNRVNVVDTQAKTFLARFLNVINRVGIRNYVKGVFNVDQAPDWHNPQYLIKLDDVVSGERIENTASEQWTKPNSVTSMLHGSSDRFAFEMDFDRSSVLIGLVWFDVDRVYSLATERQNLHYDRFDEFQPFMQYTGDQSLYRVELGSPLLSGTGLEHPLDAFGYKLRNAEYKERYDQCAGGFCNEMLDDYIFKADVLESSGIQHVGPSFIRSFPSELDRFYLSLSGYSLATYFHFIVKFRNLYSGSRPMAYAPTLL